MRQPLPPRDTAWFDPATGRPTDDFYKYVKNLESRSLADPVNFNDIPTNGQQPTFNGATGQWDYS